MRIATPDAAFAHPEIKFGAPPLFTPLQWIVGAGIARELCLTGRKVDAAEAHRIGLVNTIVDADRLEEEAIATARVMAEAPQPALEATKRYLVANAGVTFDEAFAIEHDRVFDQFLLGDDGGLVGFADSARVLAAHRIVDGVLDVGDRLSQRAGAMLAASFIVGG